MTSGDLELGWPCPVPHPRLHPPLQVCAALGTAAKVLTEEVVKAVLSVVLGLTAHTHFQVRKRAIVTLHAFHNRGPHLLAGEGMAEILQDALCDKEPSVMSMAVNFLFDMALHAKQSGVCLCAPVPLRRCRNGCLRFGRPPPPLPPRPPPAR